MEITPEIDELELARLIAIREALRTKKLAVRFKVPFWKIKTSILQVRRKGLPKIEEVT